MVRIAIKVLRIEGPELGTTVPQDWDDRNQSVLNEINWSMAEDAINDQLPEGYYCKVDGYVLRYP